MQHQRWQQIRCLCDAIVQEFHPDKIVLFGSYASGKPRPDSDVDLLVVMPFEGRPFRQAAVILGHVVRTVGVLPMDLLVRTAEQVQERLHMGDSFLRDIIAHGNSAPIETCMPNVHGSQTTPIIVCQACLGNCQHRCDSGCLVQC
jgi:predicted nucleotidyltransferase